MKSTSTTLHERSTALPMLNGVVDHVDHSPSSNGSRRGSTGKKTHSMAKPRAPRPRRSRQTPEWSTWSDPRETEKNYDKWRQQHKSYLLLQVRAEIEKASIGTGEAPLALMAARSGLSTSTIRRYLRKFDLRKRGPLATTLLALLAMKDDV